MQVIWRGKAFCLTSRSVVGLMGRAGEKDPPGNSEIILVDRMLPAEVLAIPDESPPRAIVVRYGSLIDHTAVLLNGRGIQLAVAPGIPELPPQSAMVIDGEVEEIAVYESIEQCQSHSSANGLPPTKSASHAYASSGIAVYVDGNTTGEIVHGLRDGASGIGILRTEWLEFDSPCIPAQNRQYELYASCADAVHPHILNIRLFDIGGDKVPKWAEPFREELGSPLGNRGIRAFSNIPNAYSSQLAAISAVALERPIGLVIPMVSHIDDVLLVRRKLIEIAGPTIFENVRLGMMVETPAAALTIREFLGIIDFVRIGPGDLTQFTLGKLRSLIKPEEFSGNGIDPAVRTLIQKVAKECATSNMPVDLCLDIEPRPRLLESLTRIGIRALCVSPSNVPITIRRLRGL